MSIKTEFERIFNEKVPDILQDKIRIDIMRVTSVDDTNYSCDVENQQYKFNGVPLRAFNKDNDKGFIEIPKIDSLVYIMTIDDCLRIILKAMEPIKYIIGDTKDGDGSQIIYDIEKNEINITNKDTSLNIVGDTIELTNKNTSIEILDNDVKIKSSKVHINTSSDGEPFVRGNKNKNMLSFILDKIDDLYTRYSTHTHTTAMGPTSPPTDAPAVISHITAIKTKKAVELPETVSKKNFTE